MDYFSEKEENKKNTYSHLNIAECLYLYGIEAIDDILVTFAIGALQLKYSLNENFVLENNKFPLIAEEDIFDYDGYSYNIKKFGESSKRYLTTGVNESNYKEAQKQALLCSNAKLLSLFNQEIVNEIIKRRKAVAEYPLQKVKKHS